jgi:hypothetical protein
MIVERSGPDHHDHRPIKSSRQPVHRVLPDASRRQCFQTASLPWSGIFGLIIVGRNRLLLSVATGIWLACACFCFLATTGRALMSGFILGNDWDWARLSDRRPSLRSRKAVSFGSYRSRSEAPNRKEQHPAALLSSQSPNPSRA